MSTHTPTDASRPPFDALLQQIADYTLDTARASGSAEALDTARLCLMDTLGCGLLALSYPACTKLLGPVVPDATLPGVGSRVPGTSFELDPVQAAFNIGAAVRWLDFNDTWLAAEWGHPSDNLGAILAVADYLSRRNAREGGAPLTVGDVLLAMIQAHEIQGVLALENALQPRRAGPCAARADRVHGGGHAPARRHERGPAQRAFQRLDRRRRVAYLPPRAQHRVAQELGGG